MSRIATDRIFEHAGVGNAAHPHAATLSRVTVVEVGNGASDREITIDVESILYCVAGQAALKGRIEAGWIVAVTLRPKSIYVRTAGRIYRTSFPTIAALLKRFPDTFQNVHHGVVVNAEQIELPELRRQRHLRVGFRVAGRPGQYPIEWARVSRRHAPQLRYRLGMTAHPKPRAKRNSTLRRVSEGSTGKIIGFHGE